MHKEGSVPCTLPTEVYFQKIIINSRTTNFTLLYNYYVDYRGKYDMKLPAEFQSKHKKHRGKEQTIIQINEGTSIESCSATRPPDTLPTFFSLRKLSAAMAESQF